MSDSKFNLSAEDFKNIIDNLHDEIMVYDNDYNLVYVNAACRRHYGLEPDELIGLNFGQVDNVYWGNSTLPVVYKTKKATARRQITNLGDDIITIAEPIFDKDGNLKFVAQNVNDIYYINEVSRMEEQFEYDNESDFKVNQDFFVAKSRKMMELMNYVMKIKDVEAPCLITGETGNGKSYLAKYIHSMSNRQDKPFVAVNCGCIPENLLEAELFGYVKGAFTGADEKGKKGIVASAEGGTLFLDEISEIPYNIQSKLLTFIQEKEYMPVGSSQVKKADVRIISATNRNLTDMIKSRSFREDLYYRLNIFEIVIPPLRERKDDIETFVSYFLHKYNSEYKRYHQIDDETLEVLKNYNWPGNVRELEHTIEKMVVLAKNDVITGEDLPKSIYAIKNENMPSFSTEGLSLDKAMEKVEADMIRKSYKRQRTSVGVAKELGISQPKAYRLIKKYILDEPK